MLADLSGDRGYATPPSDLYFSNNDAAQIARARVRELARDHGLPPGRRELGDI